MEISQLLVAIVMAQYFECKNKKTYLKIISLFSSLFDKA